MDIKEKIFHELYKTYLNISICDTNNNKEYEIQQMVKRELNELIDKYRPVEVW